MCDKLLSKNKSIKNNKYFLPRQTTNLKNFKCGFAVRSRRSVTVPGFAPRNSTGIQQEDARGSGETKGFQREKATACARKTTTRRDVYVLVDPCMPKGQSGQTKLGFSKILQIIILYSYRKQSLILSP